MLFWQVLFNCVTLLLFALYLIHCYALNGVTLHSVLKDSLLVETKQDARDFTSATSHFVHGDLSQIGTLHSFSYLISNARYISVGRRQQNLDIYMQLERGVTNFHFDVNILPLNELLSEDKRKRVSVIQISNSSINKFCEVLITLLVNTTKTHLYVLDLLDLVYIFAERKEIRFWLKTVEISPLINESFEKRDVIYSIRTYVEQLNYKTIDILDFDSSSNVIEWVQYFR